MLCPSIAIAASLLLAGCSSGPRFEAALPQVRDVPVLANLSPAESLTQGRGFLAARQYGLAIELFKTASRDPALKADSLNGLAIAYDGIGRSDLAERYFQQALAAKPNDTRIRGNLARFYVASGQQEKRRSLLAAPNAETRATVAGEQSIQASDAPVEPVVEDIASAVVLGEHSPLDALFEPLLVNAGLPAEQRTVPAGLDDVSVVCTTSRGDGAGGTMQMFRVGLGEVFIAAQPADATCAVVGAGDHEPGAAGEDRPLSNKEYLGLVAAQLDQLNNPRTAIDISLLWRLAFGAGELA